VASSSTKYAEAAAKGYLATDASGKPALGYAGGYVYDLFSQPARDYAWSNMQNGCDHDSPQPPYCHSLLLNHSMSALPFIAKPSTPKVEDCSLTKGERELKSRHVNVSCETDLLIKMRIAFVFLFSRRVLNTRSRYVSQYGLHHWWLDCNEPCGGTNNGSFANDWLYNNGTWPAAFVGAAYPHMVERMIWEGEGAPGDAYVTHTHTDRQTHTHTHIHT
jgi:hypothetical protein